MISTSENCRQKKKLVLKMRLFVILLEKKKLKKVDMKKWT